MIEQRCGTCRQLVGSDGFCPDCSSRRATFTFVGVTIVTSLLAAYAPALGGGTLTIALATLLCVVATGGYGIGALLLHRARKKRSESENPGITAARQAERLARLSSREIGANPAPVQLTGPPCPRCGRPLDTAGWCYHCAKRRQGWILTGLGLVPVFGFGACLFGVGGWTSPWANVLATAGMVAMGVGGLGWLVYLILSSSRIDRSRRG